MSGNVQSSKSWRMRRVTLEPARQIDVAHAGDEHGYEFTAPLDANSHISVEGWRRERALCFVHRTRRGVTMQRGVLIQRAGGANGATWMFDYDPASEGDEEAGQRFGAHAFTPGEYVSVREPNGDVRAYKVASVAPA